MQDADQNALSKGIKAFNLILSSLEEDGSINGSSAARARSIVQTTTSLQEAVENVDYVQESVYESYQVKRLVFRSMDRFAPEHATLASSSSGLLMSKIQTALEGRKRCLTVHPFNPVHLIPLVELVPGRWTSRETIDSTYDFMSAVGKVPIKVRKELLGHVANRLAAALWREAIDLLLQGAASAEEIDRACRFGPGIRWAVQGPFLTYHSGGGEGGIQYFMDHLTPSFESWWKSMAAWKQLPRGAKRKVIQSVREMSQVKNSSFERLNKERDAQLVTLLRSIKS